MHKLLGGVVVAGLLLVGCGNDDDKGTTSVTSRQSEQNTCVSPLLTGKAAGEKCETTSDCAEVCCNCSSGGKSYSAQACIESKCATPSEACQRALTIAPASCQ